METATTALALTAELFDQIVNSLKSDIGRRLNEKRTKPRVGVRGRVQILPINADGTVAQKFDVWVRDVSASGIGILHNSPLSTGSRFEAYFRRHNESPLVLTYIVAHHKAVVKGLFTIGAHLVGVDENKRGAGLMS